MSDPGADPSRPHDHGHGVRVRTHPALCNGCGNCHRWAPRVYVLDDEGYIGFHLMDVPPELAVEARLGAQVCPERAITVIETSLTTKSAGIPTSGTDRSGA